jgi:hypothetical protein
MKEKIIKAFEKFESIGLQAKAWKFYGLITPAFFLLVFISFHLMMDSTIAIFYAGWALFILSCLIWWFWTIKVFQSLVDGNKELYSMIKSVAEDVVSVKEDVKQISKPRTKNTRQSK